MLGADYKAHFTPEEPVYRGVSVSIGAAYRFGRGVESVELKARPDLAPVFPLFYTYYDTHPIGTVTLENDRGVELRDVKISFYSKQYMDTPKEAVTFESFPGNEECQVPLYAFFNDSIMERPTTTAALR